MLAGQVKGYETDVANLVSLGRVGHNNASRSCSTALGPPRLVALLDRS